MHRWKCLGIVATTASVLASAAAAEQRTCGNGSFASTFALIEQVIFEQHGCTNQVCHGSAAQGGLDLRPGHAYGDLVDVRAETVPDIKRVVPGQAAESLLWLNLAGKTLPGAWQSPLRPMPPDPLPALSLDALEAVRLWLERGAPESGVVPGTDQLLDACLPPPEPLEIRPLPPPPPAAGFQLRMPAWTLPAFTEREVCFATYYDVTDRVPPEYRGPDGTTFRYKFHETRQNPLSHHLAPLLYTGAAPVTDPRWGTWRCQEGEREGAPCDPLDPSACGALGQCITPMQDAAGCVGYGPGDTTISSASPGISVTQETAGEFPLPHGIYEELPLRGMILWTSHAFNLTDKAGKVEAWANFEFAPADEQQIQARVLLVLEQVFRMIVPPFSTQEPCHVHEFAENAHAFEWSSHMHKRGKRWRTFRGAFRCAGGPNAGRACSPLGYELDSPDVCAGSACASTVPSHAGDCDLDGAVTVDEVVTIVSIALGRAPCLRPGGMERPRLRLRAQGQGQSHHQSRTERRHLAQSQAVRSRRRLRRRNAERARVAALDAGRLRGDVLLNYSVEQPWSGLLHRLQWQVQHQDDGQQRDPRLCSTEPPIGDRGNVPFAVESS